MGPGGRSITRAVAPGGGRAQEFTVVVAATTLLGIGREGALPWRLKGDMAYPAARKALPPPRDARRGGGSTGVL